MATKETTTLEALRKEVESRLVNGDYTIASYQPSADADGNVDRHYLCMQIGKESVDISIYDDGRYHLSLDTIDMYAGSTVFDKVEEKMEPIRTLEREKAELEKKLKALRDGLEAQTK